MLGALKLVEILVALTTACAGGGLAVAGQVLVTAREAALNSRVLAFGAQRPLEPSYGHFEVVAALCTAVGGIAAVVGLLAAGWLVVS